ncbi:MAG: hypothetical protein KBH45_05270, partial [Verrucomicrobia bacterium]|nr:hypothetical protein [Verrucomicrobiota bacterium]
ILMSADADGTDDSRLSSTRKGQRNETPPPAASVVPEAVGEFHPTIEFPQIHARFEADAGL